MRNTLKQVHCIGILVVDALSRPLARYPVPGEVTQVVTDTIAFHPGGGAANTALALAQMGLAVSVFSKVGDDPLGAFLVRSLGGAGVDTSGIRVSGDDSTPFTYVGVHPDGERTFIHTPGANRTFTLADVDRARLLTADFLLYQDLWVLPGIDGRPGAQLLAEARQSGAVTLLDECWGLGPNREAWETMLPHADYVLPSFDDMRAIYPDMPPEALAGALAEKGARNVILKMGRDGCLVLTDDRLTRVASCATEIVDTTGAGDCFDAGFIAGLAHDRSVVEAAGIGNLAAAACIRHTGGAAGIPPFEALARQLQ